MDLQPVTTRGKISRILLATDFSVAGKASFEAAISLCQCLDASLYILNVFEYANVMPPESGGMLLEIDAFYKEAEESISTLIEEARHRGITCEGTIGSGVAHDAILDAVRVENTGLIVLGTRAIHGFERLIFGSTAEAVLRKASCPVYTVGPQAATLECNNAPLNGIVVFATDFHDTTVESLANAATFARVLHLPLHCLHVLPRSAEDGEHKGIIPAIIREALEHLADKLDHEDAPPVCAVTYGSEISNAVVEYARTNNARLIVLGVQRSSFVASHFPAHIAYRVIAEAPCPVLTITFPVHQPAGTYPFELKTTDLPGASLMPWPSSVLI